MRSLFLKIKKIAIIFVFALTFVSALLYIICMMSSNFAEFINSSTVLVRKTLSITTSIFPFSLFECLVIVSLIIMIVSILKRNLKITSLLKGMAVFFSLYFVLFVFTIASGYHTVPLEEKIELKAIKSSEQELYLALTIIVDELNRLSSNISYLENGSSSMQYDFSKLSDKIYNGYKKIDFINNFNSRVKPLITSKLLSYAHISGIYIPITAEANINTNYPDYVVSISAAHEMAHQRGIARENEACFCGFLALINSDDDYLKYCGYLDGYSNMLSDLKQRNKALAGKVEERLNKKVNGELKAYKAVISKYKNSKVKGISEKINNSFLQANGDRNGIKSYNISDILTAYLLSR